MLPEKRLRLQHSLEEAGHGPGTGADQLLPAEQEEIEILPVLDGPGEGVPSEVPLALRQGGAEVDGGIDAAVRKRGDHFGGLEIDRLHLGRGNPAEGKEGAQEELIGGTLADTDPFSPKILRFPDPVVPPGDHFIDVSRRDGSDGPQVRSLERPEGQDEPRGGGHVHLARQESVDRVRAGLIGLERDVEAVAPEQALRLADVEEGADGVRVNAHPQRLHYRRYGRFPAGGERQNGEQGCQPRGGGGSHFFVHGSAHSCFPHPVLSVRRSPRRIGSSPDCPGGASRGSWVWPPRRPGGA